MNIYIISILQTNHLMIKDVVSEMSALGDLYVQTSPLNILRFSYISFTMHTKKIFYSFMHQYNNGFHIQLYNF